MSYTPEDQILQPVVDKLISNINKFKEVVQNRIMDKHLNSPGEGWRDDHLKRIRSIRDRLEKIQLELIDELH